MKPRFLFPFFAWIVSTVPAFAADVPVGMYTGGKMLTSFGTDSFSVEGEMRYFNYDSLFYRIMTEGYTPEVQDINVRYFVEIVDLMPYERQQEQIERFREAGRKYNCRQIYNEGDFLTVMYYPDTTDILFEEKSRMMDSLIARMAKEGEIEFEIRCRELISRLYWKHGRYVRPFKEFPIIEELLEQIPDVNKSGVNSASKKKFYYWFGQCYYIFRDFEKAVHYYKKATIEPSEQIYTPYHQYDATNLLARIALGRYYRERQEMEASDFYFHSMLEMSDKVKRREMFDAIAWCNLGVNKQIRQEYPDAIRIMEQYLPVLVEYGRYSLAAETSASLGEALLATGQWPAVQAKIDSAFRYMSLAGSDSYVSRSVAYAGSIDQLPTLYLLAGRYYALRNDVARSVAYLDSSVYYQKKVDNRYNSLVILRAEQELFDAEKGEIKQREQLARMRMLYAITSTLLLLMILTVYIYLYYKKKRAYRALALHIRQWAQAGSAAPMEKTARGNGKLADNADLLLFEKLCHLLDEEHWHRTPDITLDSTAAHIEVNRNYLSQAVNRCTGKNFTTFINEYRVKDAVRIMSKENGPAPTIESIALDTGFNDRQNFYRVFKKVTGLSPSEFKKQLRN